MRHHPDKTKNKDDSEFINVNKAYKYLMANKAAYDKVLIQCIGNEMIDMNDKLHVIDDIDDIDEVSETEENPPLYKYECK